MYDKPCRRRVVSSIAASYARQVPADAHIGTCLDFLRRHEMEAANAAHGSKQERSNFTSCLLQRVADSRNLKCAWDWLSSGDGQAPGIDGLRYHDLESHEVWNLIRTLRTAILDDSYRVSPDKKRETPKASGHGTRTLRIPSIIDRVVQRAIVQVIQPLLDPSFDQNSFGYRPGHDRLDALAKAERLAAEQQRWTWLTDDIKDAFNQVPQRRLLDILRHHLPDDGMMKLLERVILTNDHRGLRQGGCLSPLLLNVYLDWLLDKPWKKQYPEVPLIRVADDLLLLCRCPKEAMQMYSVLKRMLRCAAMPLKNEEVCMRNLGAAESITWLGYTLHQEGDQLHAQMSDKSRNSLKDSIALSHTKPEAPIRAIESILGWIYQQGPCYPNSDLQDTYQRIESMTGEYAFDEIPTLTEVADHWHRGYLRWCRKRTTRGTTGSTSSPLVSIGSLTAVSSHGSSSSDTRSGNTYCSSSARCHLSTRPTGQHGEDDVTPSDRHQ